MYFPPRFEIIQSDEWSLQFANYILRRLSLKLRCTYSSSFQPNSSSSPLRHTNLFWNTGTNTNMNTNTNTPIDWDECQGMRANSENSENIEKLYFLVFFVEDPLPLINYWQKSLIKAVGEYWKNSSKSILLIILPRYLHQNTKDIIFTQKRKISMKIQRPCLHHYPHLHRLLVVLFRVARI